MGERSWMELVRNLRARRGQKKSRKLLDFRVQWKKLRSISEPTGC